MEIIQETRLIKTDRGHYYLFKEYKTQMNQLIKYEMLDETPILESSKHYDTYMRLRTMMIAPEFFVKKALGS